MMPRVLFRSLLVVAVNLLVAGSADTVLGQYGWDSIGEGRPGTVSGAGVVSIEKQPEVMRMHVDLIAKAGSLADALKSLNTRKQSARKQLKDLGANMDTLRFGAPSISNAQSEEQQQLAQMMTMINQRRGRGAKTETKQSAVPVTVTCPVTVEWKLTAKTPEDLLKFTHPLQQEIRDADISGMNDASALTPEQKELVEEMGDELSNYSRYSSSNEKKPGEPMFLFAAAISEEEQDRALSEAFQKAKAKAGRLAKATGAELGELVSVTSAGSQGLDDSNAAYYGNYYSELQSIQEMLSNDPADEAKEAVGMKPESVKYNVRVSAWFDFKKK